MNPRFPSLAASFCHLILQPKTSHSYLACLKRKKKVYVTCIYTHFKKAEGLFGYRLSIVWDRGKICPRSPRTRPFSTSEKNLLGMFVCKDQDHKINITSDFSFSFSLTRFS
ncbi:hypothetical protein Hanom_Chr02g00129751 [Helianthus anomalus]